MTSTFIYIFTMIAVILLWFILVKRPIYEAILISFLLLVIISGNISNIFKYILTGLSTPLIYSTTVFIAMSIILTKTGIIDGAIEIILSLLGRIPGGAGYVAVIASSFMGALSGSGPGNVMTTGSITIPAMKKSGFSNELAANITSSSSCLGNMIPPSSTIVAALAILTGLYPEMNISAGKFWIVCWGCSIWFIILRIILVFVFCKIENVKQIANEDIKPLKEVIRTGWRGLLLPFIIFIPFLMDYLFKDTLFTERLGAVGAKYFSNSLLYFVAGFVTIYAMIVVKDKKQLKLAEIARTFSQKINSIVPTISICLFGYMFGALFNDLNVAAGVKEWISILNIGKVGLCILIPLITCILGTAIVGSSMVVVFGGVLITIFASVGINPLLTAAMLPCICGVMSNMMPPIAASFLTGISLAGADFNKAVKNDFWWILTQYILEVIVLLGWLPIIGL